MMIIRTKIFFVALTLCAVAPFMAFAADSNIEALSVTSVSDTDAGDTSSYSLSLSLNPDHNLGIDNSNITFFFATEDALLPDDSGYSFTGATLPVYFGFTLDDTEITQNDEAFTMTFDPGEVTLFSWTLGFEDIQNSSTPGCYVLMATSENPGPAADYTVSDPFAIGDATCGDEEEVSVPDRIAKRELRVKNRRARSVLTKWTAYDFSPVTSYTVQYRKCKNDTKALCRKKSQYQNRSLWKKKRNITLQKKKLRRLKAGTYYQFRVRAINSAGRSEWSQWKRFKTTGSSV